MIDPLNDNRKEAWAVFAQTWVDTEYDEKDVATFVGRLVQTSIPVKTLKQVAYWEVCGSFAVFTSIVFLTAGMALPDWEYPEDTARAKVDRWVSRPLIFSLLNPLWLFGYPISLLLMKHTMGSVFDALTAVPSSGPAV